MRFSGSVTSAAPQTQERQKTQTAADVSDSVRRQHLTPRAPSTRGMWVPLTARGYLVVPTFFPMKKSEQVSVRHRHGCSLDWSTPRPRRRMARRRACGDPFNSVLMLQGYVPLSSPFSITERDNCRPQPPSSRPRSRSKKI